MNKGVGSNSDKSDEFLWLVLGIICIFALFLIVIWINFHEELSQVAIWLTIASCYVIDYTLQFLELVRSPSFLTNLIIPPEIARSLPQLKAELPDTDPQYVSSTTFFSYLSIIGISARLMLIPIAIFGSMYIYKHSKAARLRNKYKITDLARISSSTFPHLKPPLSQDLLNQDPDQGFYRREASPIRFGILYGLIELPARKQGEPNKIVTFNPEYSNSSEHIVVKDQLKRGIDKHHGDYIVNVDKVNEVFIDQLGSKWTNSTDLPPLTRALYAALIAFACGDKDTSLSLLDRFNNTWESPTKKRNYATFDTSGIDAVIAKYEPHEIIEEILERHAFVNTVLPALLREARNKGKLWTALFPWLKVVDRTLWYALNQEGGQCGWSEAAGPRAHLLAELKIDRAIYSPFISTAIDAYIEMLDEEGWTIQDSTLIANGGAV